MAASLEVSDSAELANWRRRAVVALAIALLLGGGWWLTSARAVGPYGFGFGADLDVGEQLHIGFPGLADQTISVISLHANMSQGLDGEFQVCHPRQGAHSFTGAPDLDPHCARVDTAGRGTSLAAERPEDAPVPYLVLSLTATESGEQWLCGIDVMYRSGLRFGWQRDLPVHGILNAAEDVEAPCG